jgi:hypothetical protein
VISPDRRFGLARGSHSVVIRRKGKEVFKKEVLVKPAAEGITPLEVPLLEDPDAMGTLVLQIKRPDGAARNLELFLDGKLTREFKFGFELDELVFPLSPGEHTVMLKKNGIEVYNKPVQVLKVGKTFHPIDLVVTGTVLINNRQGIPGEGYYVTVDGSNKRDWAQGAHRIDRGSRLSGGPRSLLQTAGTGPAHLRCTGQAGQARGDRGRHHARPALSAADRIRE